MMKRREFITLLGVAVAAWPLAARAQQPGTFRRIGFNGSIPLTQLASEDLSRAFIQGMLELGYLEKTFCAVGWRSAAGQYVQRVADLARELARLKVDVIVTGSAAAVRCLRSRRQQRLNDYGLLDGPGRQWLRRQSRASWRQYDWDWQGPRTTPLQNSSNCLRP